jgi:hypothetical protein
VFCGMRRSWWRLGRLLSEAAGGERGEDLSGSKWRMSSADGIPSLKFLGNFRLYVVNEEFHVSYVAVVPCSTRSRQLVETSQMWQLYDMV